MPDFLKIFLASSSELKDDRIEFELFISRRNKSLVKQGLYVELVIWEDFLDALSPDGLQKEYNKAIRDCDIFVMLYFTKVGKYTGEEFEEAIGAFREGGRPLIYTYFKDAAVTTGAARRDDLQSLWAFQDKLKTLGHYQTVYKNTEDLLLKFGGQLDRILGERGSLRAPAPLREEPKIETPPVEVPHPPKPVPPSDKPVEYKLGNIIKLLTNAFDAIGLETFAMVNFGEIHQQFTPNMVQQARVNHFVNQCRITGKLGQLLTLVEAENAYQFAQCGPYTNP